MHVISADEVYRICAWDDLMTALAAAHADEKPLVDRSSIVRDNDGVTETYLNIPAWIPGKAFGSKIITVLPQNPARFEGIPAVQALVTLFDGQTGSPRAVIDGTSLTYVKTAADSALGSRLLSRDDASVLTLVGTGGLAPFAARAHVAARPGLQTVYVWGRRLEQAKRVAAELSEFSINAEPVDDLETAVRRSDVVSCVTASLEPVVNGAWLKPGAHLDLIGAFTPEMRECDDDAVTRARLFVDSRWFAIDKPGDLADPLARGVISA
ncbi:MAG: ornithine cyclodeaminase, partial [Aestuariivirgaceae bacterium]